jgi:hypothetical protein
LSSFCTRPDPPRVIACTHFHQLFQPSILPRCAC